MPYHNTKITVLIPMNRRQNVVRCNWQK